MRAAWQDELPPDYTDIGGQVWRFNDPDAETVGDDPRIATHINGTWFLIYSPNAHPAWDWHLLMTQALVEVPGVDPPILHYPAAEYEVIVWALDPNLPPPDPRAWPLGGDPPKVQLLQPPDAVVQFHGPKRDQVYEMMDLVAKAVATGMLVPDTDHKHTWTAILQKTAEHYRGHPEHN